MALIAAHLNAGRSGGDSVAIGIYSPSSPTSIPPFPPFFPSLISRMVSVDVKHHVYLQTAIESFVLDLTHTVTLALTSLYAVSLGTPENSAIQKLTIITTIHTYCAKRVQSVTHYFGNLNNRFPPERQLQTAIKTITPHTKLITTPRMKTFPLQLNIF